MSEERNEHQHPKFEQNEQGELLLNFGSYGQEVEVAAISGDGQRMLVVEQVGTARVLDTHSADEIAVLEPSSPLEGSDKGPVAGEFVLFIESAALNQDGSLALLGLNDGTACLYHIEQGCLLARLTSQASNDEESWAVIRSVRFSPDDRLALVGFYRRSVGVWSSDGSELIAWLSPPDGDRLVRKPFVRDTLVSYVDASLDGKIIFAGASDQTATFYDLESQELLHDFREHAEATIAIFADTDELGWVTSAGSVWRALEDDSAEKILDAKELWAEAVVENRRVLARTLDDSIVLWSFEGQREVLQDSPSKGRCSDEAGSLWLSNQDMFFPRGSKTLELRVGGERCVIEHSRRLTKVESSPDGELLATSGRLNQLELWDVATGQLAHTLPCPGGVGSVAFSPDGQLVVLGELGHGGGFYDRAVFLYETASAQKLHTIEAHQWQVRQVAFSPSGRRLATLGNEAMLWTLDELGESDPLLRVQLRRSTGQVAFWGERLVLIDEHKVRVFEDEQCLITFASPLRYQQPWMIEQRLGLLIVSDRQLLHCLDLASGELVRAIRAPLTMPGQFPPAEVARKLRLASTLLWSVEAGEFIHQSDGPRGWISPLELTAHGIVVPGRDRALVVATSEQGLSHALIPFEGRLRASRVTDKEALLINHKGQLYRSTLPPDKSEA